MQQEIEAKFLNTDHALIKQKLLALGGNCVHETQLMRRAIFHNETMGENAFVRVRDEGDRVTFTYKRFDEADKITGVREAETTLGDFETAVTILRATGLHEDAYQETRREVWQLHDVEIMLDEWPWLQPFIEIEGPSEQTVKDMAVRLGFDWQAAVFGSVVRAYVSQYPALAVRDADTIVNRQTPVIRFGDPVPSQFL